MWPWAAGQPWRPRGPRVNIYALYGLLTSDLCIILYSLVSSSIQHKYFLHKPFSLMYKVTAVPESTG